MIFTFPRFLKKQNQEAQKSTISAGGTSFPPRLLSVGIQPSFVLSMHIFVILLCRKHQFAYETLGAQQSLSTDFQNAGFHQKQPEHQVFQPV